MDIFQQNVLVDEDMFDPCLECDVRPVLPESPEGFSYDITKIHQMVILASWMNGELDGRNQ